MATEEIKVHVEHAGGLPVLVVSGEIDVYTSPTLREHLVEAVGEEHPTVVLDLRAVTFLDSTGLGVLITGLKRCRSAGGELHIVTTQPNVLKVLEITGLDEVFRIHQTVEEATAAS